MPGLYNILKRLNCSTPSSETDIYDLHSSNAVRKIVCSLVPLPNKSIALSGTDIESPQHGIYLVAKAGEVRSESEEIRRPSFMHGGQPIDQPRARGDDSRAVHGPTVRRLLLQVE